MCFISSLSGGGAERQMLELIKVLLNNNCSVTLLTYSKNDDYECPHGVKRVNIKSSNKLILVFKLIYFIRNFSCDCCISFLSVNNIVSCLATFPKKKAKLIVGERNLSKRYSLFEKILYFLYKRADYIVPNSNAQSFFIKEHAKSLSEKIVTINNYTDTDKFIPLRLYNKSEKIKVGIFARYSYQKNPLLLYRIAMQLKYNGNKDFEFHWFGNNKLNGSNLDEVSPAFLEFKKAIINNDLTDTIYLHDFSKDILGDMNKMHVISLLSFYEGFPNSISEGMACGKAIIASCVSDIPFMVEDGVNGFLFDSDNEDSAVTAFLKYFSMTETERLQMGVKSRDRALYLFSKEKFEMKYLELINIPI